MISQNDFVRLLTLVASLERRIEQLETIVHESRDFVILNTWPLNPFDGQIVLRSDITGAAAGGQMFRYDAGSNTWLAVT